METKECEKQLSMGGSVIFFDQFGMEHNALLTNVFGKREVTTFKEEGAETLTEQISNPCVNVLLVSPDVKREDSYGRQIERQTSVMHYSQSTAWGNFYCLPEEIEEARKACKEAKVKEYADK